MKALLPRTDTTFPSDADRLDLHQKITTLGFKSLEEIELWRWHAYIYGSRRVWFNDHAMVSPVDPDSSWFDAIAIDRAEVYFRQKLPKFKPPAADKVKYREAREHQQNHLKKYGTFANILTRAQTRRAEQGEQVSPVPDDPDWRRLNEMLNKPAQEIV